MILPPFIKFLSTFMLLLIILILLSIILKDNFKIFIKVLIKYSFVSIIIISIFTLFYLAIVELDMHLFFQHYSKGFNGLNLTKALKIQKLNQYMEIQNLGWSEYTSVYKILIDLFYFSSMTFFTVGYGDITIIGSARFYPILEALIGVATTSIFISIALSEHQKLNNTIEYVKIRLNNGWNILDIHDASNTSCFSKLFKHKLYHITLINNLYEIKTYHYVQLDENSRKFIDEFKIKWDFTLLRNQCTDYFIKFASYLYVKLHLTNHELMYESYKFIKDTSKFNSKDFCSFLNRILHVEMNNKKNTKADDDSSLLNNEILDTLYSAIKVLQNKIIDKK